MKKLLLISLFALPAQTYASGCMWTTEYVQGNKVLVRESEGHLECKHDNGQQFCSFYEKGGVTENPFTHYEITPAPTLPANDLIKVNVERFEAMEWYNCDGSDPVPDYVANGTLEKFEINGKVFTAFTSNN